MLNFLQMKKVPQEYPSLTSRLFAAIIDFTILLFFFIPFQNFFRSFTLNRSIIEKEFSTMDNTADIKYSLSSFFSPQFQSKLFHLISQMEILPVIIGQVFQMIIVTVFVLFFWIKYQATPGKFFISAKIVSASTNRKPSIRQFVIRYLAYGLSAFLFFIGFFIIPFNRHRRALHDFIAGTKVISTK